jgi:hypothetical protein
MTACGQTKLHWPHWTQIPGSQTGTESAIFRFSNAAVPEGKVPSGGIRLTGISSPRASNILAVTLRTNSGAFAGTSGPRSQWLVAATGTFASWRTFADLVIVGCKSRFFVDQAFGGAFHDYAMNNSYIAIPTTPTNRRPSMIFATLASASGRVPKLTFCDGHQSLTRSVCPNPLR